MTAIDHFINQVEPDEGSGRWKPYPAYKDSGLEWLGEVPEQWSFTKVKYSTYVKGRVGWQNLRSDEFVNEGPYCVTGTDFEDGKINWDKCYHVTYERYKIDSYIQLKPNDLLITKDGSIGKLALVGNLPDFACLNSGLFVTRPFDNQYLTKYFYWVLSSKVFFGFIDYMSAGSTIQHLYQYVFQTFQFPLPFLSEQYAIATFLERETTKIDDLIAKKQRLIELLQEKRTTLISQAVTKGLDPNVQMKDSGVEWLGEVPEHWQIGLVKRHFQIDLGKMLDGNKQPENEVTKPYLRAANIFWEGVWLDDVNEMKFSRNQMNRYRLKKGDLLVTEGGATVGRSTIWQGEIDDCYYQNSLNRARSYGNTSVKFLFFWLYALKMNGFIDILAEKATFGHLTKEKLEEIQMTIPPAKEQLQIINFLDRETAKIDALSSKVQSAIQKLKEYRTALISATVTGKVDVRGYLPIENEAA